jgi:hypothetical protein
MNLNPGQWDALEDLRIAYLRKHASLLKEATGLVADIIKVTSFPLTFNNVTKSTFVIRHCMQARL